MARPVPKHREPIAVIGTACRFPGPASCTSKLWDLLVSPSDISKEIPQDRFKLDAFYHPDANHHGTFNTRRSYFVEEDIRHFDASFFHIHPREAETMDPQQRILLETVFEAMESAGLTLDGMQGSQTSVFVGGMSYDFRDSLYIRDPASIPEYAATGAHASILAARISYFFDWKGPCMSIDTACSSSLVAVHQAVQTLRNGDATVAVAAGSNLILEPEQYIALSNLHMLSPTGQIRMWDADADGYARGEGFGAVMLKTLSQALRDGDDIQCIIRETGVSQDGKTTGITMPSAEAQTSLIRRTYERAGLDLQKESDRPQYFEAHGTGTPAGDPIEAKAITEAFYPSEDDRSMQKPLYVGSIKTVVGHLEGAAGIAGLIKACLAVQHGSIPPNLHFKKLNPKIAPFYGQLQIPTSCKPWPALPKDTPRRVSVNSFGFGGTNAHAIVESYAGSLQSNSTQAGIPLVTPLVISARSDRSLRSQAQCLLDFLEAHTDVDIEGIARTLQLKRTQFPYGAHISGTTRDQILSSLSNKLSSNPSEIGIRASSTRPRLLGVFTGQGAQEAQMGKALIEQSLVARNTLKALEQSLATLPDPPSWSLTGELLAPPSSTKVQQATLSQPLCTAIQIILVDYLYAANIKLDSVVGHSSGEIAAAYASGYITASSAIRIAYYRGLHAKHASGRDKCSGGMMAVGMSFVDAKEFCSRPEYAGRISAAASNASSSSTLSGDIDAIELTKNYLDSQKVFARRLVVDTAYHSHHMQPCANPYFESLSRCDIEVSSPRSNCNWVSSVYESGDPTEKQSLKDSYWVDNMVCPVLFSQSINRAASVSGPFDIALEIGAHPALKGPATETLSSSPTDPKDKPVTTSYHGTLQRGQDSVEVLESALGFLWERCGVSQIDFDGVRSHYYGPSYRQPNFNMRIPTYSWDHNQTFYRESRLSNRYLTQSMPSHDLLGTKDPGDPSHIFRFRNLLSLKSLPWLSGHSIQGQATLPACWYVAATLEAATLVSADRQSTCVEIQNFDLVKAVTFEDGETVELMLQIRLNDTESTDTEIVADVEATSASLFCTSVPERTFRARVTVHLADMAVGDLASLQDDSAMEPVDTESFYEYLAATGLGYSDAFHNLLSVRRKHHQSQTTGRRQPTPLLTHPATLDLALQSLLAAYFDLDDGQPSLMLLPRKIERIVFNVADCSSNTSSRSNMTFQSVVTEHSSYDGMAGDIEVLSANGKLEVQFEGVSWTPLTAVQPLDDRKLFAKNIWEDDIRHGSPITVPEYTQEEQQLVRACDRIAMYYYRQLRRMFTDSEVKQAEWHYTRLFAFIDHVLQKLRASEIPTVKTKYLNDTHDDVVQLLQKHPDSADLQLIFAVGENLPTAIKERRPMLEFMMADDRLNQYYQNGLGYGRCYQILHTMVARIAHRYPRMKILEAGAGTGGATKHILDAINGKFHSYTFTDVSTGFFEKAQDRFRQVSRKMVFKVFDLEQDPLDQGYEAGSYDLILGSLVLHATKDLHTTLRYVRSLLKPGGYLVLVEGSEETLRSGFMMAGLPGWWLGGEDRQWGPMMNPTKWDALLKRSGFSGIDLLGQDSGLPFTNLGSVFVAQAVDSKIALLREPLAEHGGNIARHVTIVGGSSDKLRPLRDNIVEHLQPHVRIVNCGVTLSGLSQSHLPAGSPVLCLSDIEEPIFKNIDEARLRGLQSIVSKAERFMFVTNAEDPYSAALVGLVRSLRLEILHLKIQVLSTYGGSIAGETVAETFMSLVHHPGSQSSEEYLWSLEPELRWQNGILSIPRIKHDDALNNRLNSSRRRIIEPVNPAKVPIEVAETPKGYDLRIQSVEPEYMDKATVYYSTLHRLKLGFTEDNGSLQRYLCFGHLHSTGKDYIFLSNSNASIQTVSRITLEEMHVAIEDVPRLLYSVACQLLAYRTFQKISTGSVVLINDGDPLMRQAIRSENISHAGHTVDFVTSNRGAAEPDVQYIPSIASTRQIRKSLNSTEYTVLLNCSVKPISKTLRGCFPTIPCVSFLEDEGRLFRSNHLHEERYYQVLSRIVRQCTANLPAPKDKQRLDGIAQSTLVSPNAVQNSSEMGSKISIVDWVSENAVQVDVRSVTETFHLFQQNKTYLLVGLTGSMGKSLCEWMINQGARNLILTSRDPQIDRKWLDQLPTTGARIMFCPLDVCDKQSLQKALRQAKEKLPPIAGVVNGAMVLRDGSFQDMSIEAMREALAAKVQGTLNLDEAFGDSPLDFFIMLSSIAWTVGNPGQSNYSAANGFMVGLARQRRQRGLAASAMNIGVVTGVGYLARTRGGKEREHAKRRNVMTISPEELHTIFAEAIVAGRPNSGHDVELITGLNGAIDTRTTPKESLAGWLSDPRVSHLVVDKNDEIQQDETVKTEVVPLQQQLTSSGSRSESLNAVIHAFSVKLERMLLLQPGAVHEASPLIELGVDSLLAVEIRSFFMVELKVDVPILKILSGATVNEVSSLTLERFEQTLGAPVEITKQGSNQRSLQPHTGSPEEDTASSNGNIDTPGSDDEQPIACRREVMSHCQVRMWRVNQHTTAPRVNDLSWALSIEGPLDVARFRKAFATAVCSYEVLRSRFFQEKGQMMQEVMDEPSVRLELKHISGDDEADTEFDRLNNTLFDLPSGKVMKASLLSLSDNSHILMCSFHHIVIDTRSCEILLDTINQLYQGQSPPPPKLHPADFARYERDSLTSGSWTPSIAYWKSQHDTHPTLLPLFPFSKVPSRQPMADFKLNCIRQDLSPTLTTAIKRFCAPLKITPYHFHLTIFQLLLSSLLPQLSGDICIGAVDAGRAAHPGYEDVFGPMFSYLPLRFRVSAEKAFAELARATRSVCYTAAGHAQVPFDVILEALEEPIEALPRTHHPLYQAQINYLQHNLEEVRMGREGELVLRERNASGVNVSYDFCVSVLEREERGARVSFEAQEYLYGVEDVRGMAERYEGLVRGVLEERKV